MTEKNISAVKYSRFQFIFYVKTAIPPTEISHSPLKIEILSSPPPPFGNLVGGSNPQQKGGGGRCTLQTKNVIRSYRSKLCKKNAKKNGNKLCETCERKIGPIFFSSVRKVSRFLQSLWALQNFASNKNRKVF